MQTSGSGFDFSFGQCSVESTTSYATGARGGATLDEGRVIGRSVGIACAGSITSSTFIEIALERGYATLTYGSEVPAGTSITQAGHDLFVVGVYSGPYSDPFGPRSSGSMRRQPIRLANTVFAHLLFVALVSGMYPAITFVRGPLRRLHRRRRGRCTACGYDLTGNVSGTCPECGGQLPTDETGAPASIHPISGS